MQISKYFTLKEAIYLPSFKRDATVDDGLTSEVEQNLAKVFAKMDLVREFLGNKPIIVHCAYRPAEYNRQIGGAKGSAHVSGLAVDFHVKGLDCDEVRRKIVAEGKLEEWGMRMEDLPGSNWVHLDIREPAPGRPRLFKP